jgi:16S rRNA (cytosine1402-N4)-methyltransferase
MNVTHIPVLADEVMRGLALQPGMTAVDGTCGLGGHTALLAEAVGPQGKVIACDKDERNLRLARERLTSYGSRIQFVHDSYVHMGEYVPEAHGILLDLGYSSAHVDDPLRGFSFQADGPLDMRYDVRDTVTAEVIVNGWSRDDLMALFRQYGEEPRAPQVAKAIFEARREMRITRTTQLAEIIASVVPRTGKIHQATRVFQALRIAVNDELGAVQQGIASAISTLAPKGRLAIISFHSLEDRMVKHSFLKATGVQILTKKPLVATRSEQETNPRSRSAKLRILERG